jgi:two-component system cell cycle sensor histidine kinase/response regulator CckA
VADAFDSYPSPTGGVSHAHPADGVLRPLIADSWRRSRAAGVDPEAERILMRHVPEADLERRRVENAWLIEIARPHLDWLSGMHAATPHVAYVVDRDGIVMYATGTNPETVRAFGQPGHDWSEARMGTNGAGTALMVDACVAVEGPEHFTRALRGHACTAAPVHGPTGELIGAVDFSVAASAGVSACVTVVAHVAYAIEQELRYRDSLHRTSGQLAAERRLADEQARRLSALDALRESEARSERNAANAPGMVYQFVYRADGTKAFTMVSEGSRALVGLAPETILRDYAAIFSLVHPDDQASFMASADESNATLAPWRWEGRIVLATGEEKYIQAGSRPERQPDGSVVCDGLLMDVTERWRAAARLEESERRYRSLFDNHPDAVFSLDTSGRFVSVNPACVTTSGYRADELEGRSFAMIISPEFSAASGEHFAAALTGRSQHNEIAIRHKSGRRVEIDVTTVPVVIGGTVVGMFGIAKDLTTRRELEAQLRQAQKMEAVGQLAGGIAHDFNNLLAAITGYAELLRADITPDDERRADVDEILKAARRAAGLTRQLLAFSRKQVLQPEALDLNELVREVAAMLRPLLGASLQLVAQPAPLAAPVLADRTQIEQMLMNLALNARDAMPQGGRLTMEVQVVAPPPGGRAMATLLVTDTGVGMSPEVQSRAFEPFFTTKPVGQGTGLGLATVHGIVQQSGGTVSLTSELGMGTTVGVSLPLDAPAPAVGSGAADADAAAPTALAAEPEGATVLLVEDEVAVRDIAQRLLHRAGYRVLVASNGADALRLLAQDGEPVDVLLSDVVMPVMGGVELASSAAARWPALRVVLMSGYADTDVGAIGQHGVAQGFVAKPFTAESLLGAVRDAARDRSSIPRR